jgi:P22_AR N-terminal domain
MEKSKDHSLEAPEVIPVEQDTILFYSKPLIVVRLPDGRPAVVVRSLCDNMQLDRFAQIRRIQRTEAIADDLIPNVLIETEGGPQKVQVLILRSVPYWLIGINPKQTRPELREEIIRYQKEAVDVLYSWAQAPRALPTTATELVPAESPTKPIAPQMDASDDDWIAYHQKMFQWHQWRQDMQTWRAQTDTKLELVEHRQNEFESRMEGVEAVTDLIPEILERLGPETLTTQHQRQVQVCVKQLSQVSGKHSNTIYENLKDAFQVPRYQDLPEAEWPQVEQWFKMQIERARKPSRY